MIGLQAMMPSVTSIFIGQPQTIEDDRGTWRSSIRRKAVHAPIAVNVNGLEGDRVTQSYHGSPGAAVCVHLLDHYIFWNKEYGLKLEPGGVGENFTLAGITEDSICAGDIILVGTTLFQVSGPRVPCANLTRHIGQADWVKKTIRENRTGFYLRVLKPGLVCAGNNWLVQERPNPGGSISKINKCMYLTFDAEAAKKFTGMSGLADWWKQQFSEKLRTKSEHWTETMRR